MTDIECQPAGMPDALSDAALDAIPQPARANRRGCRTRCQTYEAWVRLCDGVPTGGDAGHAVRLCLWNPFVNRLNLAQFPQGYSSCAFYRAKS